MTQVATTTSDAGLRSGIARVIGRQRGLLRLIRLLQGTRGVLGMLLGLLLFDALWPMAAFVRVAVSIGVLVVVVLATMRLRLARTNSRESFRVARKLEQWFGISSNALINALWFEKSGLTGVLAERSIEQGCREFHELDTNDALDRRGLRGQTLKLAVIALTWVAVWMIQPRLIGGGLLRFADPFGDHPPFSLTVFDIRVSPDAIKFGDDATVNVVLYDRMAKQGLKSDKSGNELIRASRDNNNHLQVRS